VVGILVGIFGTVPFRREPSFDDLAGTPFLKNLAETPGGWYFGWYFWYCTFWQGPPNTYSYVFVKLFSATKKLTQPHICIVL
jgi:hypothetical protein